MPGVPELAVAAAFDLLRWYSQQRNVKVRDLAAGLVDAVAGQPVVPVTRRRVDRLLADLTDLPVLLAPVPASAPARTGEPDRRTDRRGPVTRRVG